MLFSKLSLLAQVCALSLVILSQDAESIFKNEFGFAKFVVKRASVGSGTGGSDSTTEAGAGCGHRFIPSALNDNVTKYCVELIGMHMENFPPKKDDLVKINYDDKVVPLISFL
jgi:hypothetical protein